jgi:hypothetical protein
MKIAIVYNEKSEGFEAYHFSVRFRLFGPSCLGFIDWWPTVEGLIARVKKRIYGKVRFIRVVEI